GQQWEIFMTVATPTLSFTGLAPGAQMRMLLTNENNFAGGGNGTSASFRTLLPPIWRAAPTDVFDRGALYIGVLNFDGEPRTEVSLVDAPAGMFFEYGSDGQKTGHILWNGDASAPVNLTLRLQNSL